MMDDNGVRMRGHVPIHDLALRAAVVNRADYAKQTLDRRMAADRRMTGATPSKKLHSLILTGPIFDAVTFSFGA